MPWVPHSSPEITSEAQWRSVVATILAFTGVALLAVGLRFWVRRKGLMIEDWVTLGTMILSLGFVTASIIQARLGLEQHTTDSEHQKPYLIANYVAWPLYLWGLAGFKLALCIGYLRLVKGSLGSWHRIFIVGVATLSSLIHTIFVIIYLFPCRPLSRIFDASVEGSCLPYAAINYTVSATVISLDIIIFLLPVPLIQRLKLDRTVKIGLTVTFSLGLLTTVLTIMRATQINRIVYGDGNTTHFVVRGTLELNIGIMTSCLPFLRSILSLVPQKLRTCCGLFRAPNDQTQDPLSSVHTIGGSVLHLHRNSSNLSLHPTVGPRASTLALPPLITKLRARERSREKDDFRTRPRCQYDEDDLISISVQGGRGSHQSSPVDSQDLEAAMRFGGVLKTVHVEVESTAAPAVAEAKVKDWGEFGRGRTRREVWERG
ncbi:unnamed protein product [Zymoseptoria tritici ST99CH_3D1]|nr:unnamed protein product [Zymoseptoria tritici ST99CH_3D1]